MKHVLTKDTGNSNNDADTFTVALSGNGKYFYSVDSKASKISIGTRKNLKKLQTLHGQILCQHFDPCIEKSFLVLKVKAIY